MKPKTRNVQSVRSTAALILVAALAAACGTKTPLALPSGPATPPLLGGPASAPPAAANKPATPPATSADNNAAAVTR